MHAQCVAHRHAHVYEMNPLASYGITEMKKSDWRNKFIHIHTKNSDSTAANCLLNNIRRRGTLNAIAKQSKANKEVDLREKRETETSREASSQNINHFECIGKHSCTYSRCKQITHNATQKTNHDERCVKNQHEFGVVERGMSSNENTSKMPEMDSNKLTFQIKDNYTTKKCSVRWMASPISQNDNGNHVDREKFLIYVCVQIVFHIFFLKYLHIHIEHVQFSIEAYPFNWKSVHYDHSISVINLLIIINHFMLCMCASSASNKIIVSFTWR